MKKVLSQYSSPVEDLHSAASEVTNENVLMDILTDEAEDLVADIDTGLLYSVLRMGYCIFL